MTKEQLDRFEKELVRLRKKWEPIKDPEVNYHFPIPDTTMKAMFLEKVAQHPDKPYIYRHGKVQTYGECNEAACRIANSMLELGLEKGDRIMTLVSNSREFIELAQACFKTGIIMVNSNPLATSDEMISRIRDCTPAAVFVDSDGLTALMTGLAVDRCGVRHVISCPAQREVPETEGVMDWSEFMSDDTSEPEIEISQWDTAVLQYTGGTTGVLKGCCQTNHAFVAKAMAQREYFKPILTGDDWEHYMVMIGLGMSHAFGFSQAIVVNMTIGGSIYLADSLTEILQAIEKYRPTVWPSVPIWMKLIASDPQYQCYDITSLKCITCGAAPLPVEVLRKVEEITGGVITEGYGMTETVNTIAINGFHHRKSGTVGVPNPNIEYLIVDAEDGVTPMPDGQDGEIICRGECVMHEYWQKPEESANMVRDGWLYTGDIGHVDEEGYLVIRDRKKDLIITSGFNVFPTEIEEVVMRCPGVADCIAIGIPNERRGEVPAVYVQAAPGAEVDLKQVEDACREKLSRYKVPKAYFMIDEIPKTKNRKPDRKKLKADYLLAHPTK